MSFTGASYYIPNYFQVLGASATMSGVRLIPFSLGGSLFAIIGGQILARTGQYRPTIWVSWCGMVLSFGLLYILDEKTSTAVQVILCLLCGVACGSLFPVPFIALQAAMPLKDMATSTSTMTLLRFIGGTIGISVGDAIYEAGLRHRLPRIQGYNPGSVGMTNDLRTLQDIQPVAVRDQVLHAYTRSISIIWIVFCACNFVGLLLVLPIRAYSLKRQAVNTPGKAKAADSSEPPSRGEAAEPEAANGAEATPSTTTPAELPEKEEKGGNTTTKLAE